MMPRFRKADIETHSERFSGRKPAVNVKVYSYQHTSKVQDAFKCSEPVAAKALEYAFESAQQRFWEDAQDAAQDIFGPRVKVCSEGRSGGWLIVAGINEDVESWDAIAVAKWARLVKWAQQEIEHLTSWETVREDIEANAWAKEGAELYNYMDLKDGRTVTMSELKNAHLPPKGDT